MVEMDKEFLNNNEWALILGGSSGLGLATAKKLAQHGMNIIIIHRNRKSELSKIQDDFDQIKELGVNFLSYNIDLLKPEKQKETILTIKDHIKDGRIKTLVHSIAKGNLKPMVDANHACSYHIIY